MVFDKFANPDLLWLLVLLPLMVAYYIYRTRQGGAAVRFSSIDNFVGIPKGITYYLRHIPFVMRLGAVALLIVAIARPERVETSSNSNAEGIDIMIALDISSSMLARDFKPDRFEAAKDISSKFILERPTDRVGLVIFAGEAFTQSPLTTDQVSLVNLLSSVQMGVIADGTAIGNGLATAVNRLKESQAKSKVIVLLTDGVNNSGQIDPMGAAEIAKEYGIRVYTIGVGTQGVAPYPTYDPWGNIIFQDAKVEIDEKLMQEIAQATGGRYFRATDNTKLAEIYAEINSLEKTKVEVENYTKYSEVFHPFLLLALILLLLEIACRYFVFKQLP